MEKLNAKKKGTDQCQRCLKHGHLIHECKNHPAYLFRPSRTAIFK